MSWQQQALPLHRALPRARDGRHDLIDAGHAPARQLAEHLRMPEQAVRPVAMRTWEQDLTFTAACAGLLPPPCQIAHTHQRASAARKGVGMSTGT